jgi:hypothetical protein
MQESDYVCKISLMITDEEYIFFRKLLQVFGALDTKLIHEHEARVRKYTNHGVNDLTNETKIFEPFPERSHEQSVWQNAI